MWYCLVLLFVTMYNNAVQVGPNLVLSLYMKSILRVWLFNRYDTFVRPLLIVLRNENGYYLSAEHFIVEMTSKYCKTTNLKSQLSSRHWRSFIQGQLDQGVGSGSWRNMPNVPKNLHQNRIPWNP